MLWALIKHECRLQVIPKQTWIALAGLHVVMASLFYGLITQFEDKLQSQLISKTAHYGITEDALHPYLAWCLLLMMLCIPVCNNNTLSHEQKHRTIHLYRMASVPIHMVVLAKFLTGWFFWTMVIVSLSILPFSLQFFGHIDSGQLFSGLLGVFLIAGSVQAISLLFNAYCRQPIYAILLSFTVLLVLSFFEWLAPYSDYGNTWLQNASFLYHVKNLLNGLINSPDILYYFWIIGFCLLMAIDTLKPHHWKNTLIFSIALTTLSTATILGNHFPVEKDLSENRLNSLQQDTERLLTALDSPLTFTLNLDKRHPYFEDIVALLKNVRCLSSWVRTQNLSTLVAEHGINVPSNQLQITYKDRYKTVDLTQSRFNESSLYQTLYPLMHHSDHWLLFAQGHGERSIYDPSPKSYTHLFALLKENGSFISAISLQDAGFIPDNTQILILSPNPLPFLPSEVSLIQQYLNKGGNLLWLMDDKSDKASLSPLFSQLGIVTSGKFVAPNHPGLHDPNISLISHYSDHPITASLQNISVFPNAIDIQVTHSSSTGWATEPLLSIKKQNTAIPIGIVLERPHPNQNTSKESLKTQRIMVIGNGQFLANETILNYANRELVQRMVDWLADNDINSQLIPRPAVDDYFVFPTYSQPLYQIACPLSFGLLSCALGFWIHRRRINKSY
jgi:hypothetical protein